MANLRWLRVRPSAAPARFMRAEKRPKRCAAILDLADSMQQFLHTYSCIATHRRSHRRARATDYSDDDAPATGVATDAGSRMMRCTRGLCAAIAVLLAPSTFAALSATAPNATVSADWRDAIVYFAMIDRFDDGDPSNNDQGVGEHDPTSGAHYSGGDLAGLTRRLDYIRGLGATALWITPPVRHQWWDGEVDYGGYHGYWGEHFAEVDPHFGTLADYRALADGLHARGMRLIQDIVVNHTGNYFAYAPDHDPRQPARDHRRNPAPGPNPAPTQWPFSLNDARDPAQLAADIYHWTPAISDFSDPRQEQTWQLASLDDLNTGNPTVRRALRASYGHWIRSVGVDAFRVDTAFYVEPAFFRDFLHADDPQAPGILRVAAQAGREPFHVFGEGFGIDAPFQDVQARKIERWSSDAHGPLLPAMINFPLYGSLLDVFARGRPPAVLGHRIGSMMQVHARPHLMPSFVDNHDVDRFLAGGDNAGLQLALLAIHTLPGIPVIYYGTEQGFIEPRAAMFAHGHGAGGRDHFDPSAPMYRQLQRLARLRRDHRALSRGVPQVLRADAAAPGAHLHAMRDGDETLFVALNSASHPVLVAEFETGLAPGTILQPVFALDGEAQALVPGHDGHASVVLPARSGQVWRAAGRGDVAKKPPTPTLDPLPDTPLRGVVEASGASRGVPDLALVIDGNVTRAIAVTPRADGRWRARIDVGDLVDPAIEHELRVWSPTHHVASNAVTFRVEPRWRQRVRYSDPTGDDHGPAGRYLYPTDPIWREHRPADIRDVRVSTSGASLRVEIGLAELVATWNPPNGFDHVALTLFVELPGRPDGARTLPGQQAELPGGMRWHVRARIGGWAHTLTTSKNADAHREGEPAASGATLDVDHATDTITLTVPAAALDHPSTLDGARVYLTTWDYDGGFRALAPEPSAFTFGGGSPPEPRVMDDSAVLVLAPLDP
jgi:glycosidase